MGEAVYIRVSTTDQNTARQYEIVKQGMEVFEDKCSGSTVDRPALQELIRWVRKGDTVHVHSIDRMARDLLDLQKLVEIFNERGAALVFHKENLTFTQDSSDAMSKLMLHIFGAVAEFERARIKDRQAEGIAKAKAAGKYKGGKPRLDEKAVIALLEQGIGATEITRRLNVSRASVYNIKKKLPLAL
ncbi:recombinase family protein [Endozoicomonas sp. 4G]|uniref:recombinase family protein n=1 Tax=Endozoicomonas sp. 4G TaxID=2872754 RepID=UPI002078B586|nr:recombinase family protein [Endozoicomonas sp. 4G]